MDKLKNLTIVALFLIIGILLLLQQCTPKPKDNAAQVKSDTIRTIRIDTVYPEAKIITKTVYLERPISSKKVDFNSGLCDIINTYQDSLVDSNITITNHLIAQGELKSNEITYQLHVPLRITKTINTIVTDSIFITKHGMPHYSVFTGLQLGGNQNSLSSIQPFIGLRYKKEYFTYGYNIVNSTHNIGFAINLFNIK